MATTFSLLLNTFVSADEAFALRVCAPVAVAIAISLIVKVKDTT